MRASNRWPSPGGWRTRSPVIFSPSLLRLLPEVLGRDWKRVSFVDGALACLHFAGIYVSQEEIKIMPTLTVRDVSPEVLSRLKELAKRNGRSMEQQVKLLL